MPLDISLNWASGWFDSSGETLSAPIERHEHAYKHGCHHHHSYLKGGEILRGQRAHEPPLEERVFPLGKL